MKKYVFLILMILWMAIIFYFSSAPADVSGEHSMSVTEKVINAVGLDVSEDTIGIIETVIRKIAHLTEYLILGVLACLFMRETTEKKSFLVYAFVICVIYAVTDEIHQSFVPGRACRFYDMCIDSLGALAGVYLFKLFSKRKKSRNKSE